MKILVRLLFIPLTVCTYVFTGLTADPTVMMVAPSQRPMVICEAISRAQRVQVVDETPDKAPVASQIGDVWPIAALMGYWATVKRYMAYAFTFKHKEVDGAFYGFQYQLGH